MRLMGIDPGMTTGVATAAGDNVYRTYQLDTLGLTSMRNNLDVEQPDVVAYEDFKYRPNLMKAELYSLQVIGVIRLWGTDQHRQCVPYLPAMAKAFWTDVKIKKLGLWHPGQPHGMDALRVLLTHRGRTDVRWFANILDLLA